MALDIDIEGFLYLNILIDKLNYVVKSKSKSCIKMCIRMTFYVCMSKKLVILKEKYK